MGRRGKKAVAAGGAAVLGAGVLVGLSTFAWGDLPEVPEEGTQEFVDMLAGVCGSTKGEIEGIKKYRWHTGSGGDWSPVEADGCEFTVKEERTEQNVHKKYPGDWRSANVWNCSQTEGNKVTKQYQDTRVDLYDINWSVGASVSAGLFDIFTVGFEASTGGAYQTGTWIWEGTTIDVLPGYVGWLESSQNLKVVKGDFKLNFPHRLRDHYFWYLNDFEVKTPTGEGTTFAQFRPLTDDEIRQNCPEWDWSKPDPRKNGNGDNGGENGGGDGGGENNDPKIPAWEAQKYYSLGEKVTFDGVTYECIRAHQAAPGWEPAKTPDLWRRL
ncbi:carbohydrate-binding protein [Spirillospora sp. NPDC049024]